MYLLSIILFLLSISISSSKFTKNENDNSDIYIDKLVDKIISSSGANLSSLLSSSLTSSPSLPSSSSSSSSLKSSLPLTLSTIPSIAERRKAVTIGLNRWIKPLTIQVPDVISNLIPSSSNIIKVLDDSSSTNKTQMDKNKDSNDNNNNNNNNNPFLNYDPIKLLNDFDQQQNIFANQPYTGNNNNLGLNAMTKFLPNSSPYFDEGTIGEMQNAMIPMNIMPTSMMNNMMSSSQHKQHLSSSPHYMDYANHHDHNNYNHHHHHHHNYDHDHHHHDHHPHDHHNHNQQTSNRKLKSSTKPNTSTLLKKKSNFANFDSMESINGGKNRYVDNYSQNIDNDDDTMQFKPMKTDSNFMSSPIQSSTWNDEDDAMKSNENFDKSSFHTMDQSDDKPNEKISDEKLDYYKKFFESFDDDSNSFSEVYSSPSKRPQHQSRSQDETNYSHAQNNPELSQQNNEQQNFYHQKASSIRNVPNQQMVSNDERQTNSENSLLQQQQPQHHTQQDSIMEQYYGKNENKYLTASASEIAPIILPLKPDETLTKSLKLPLMVHESYPDHHLKTNHPRPVASRFKEFFKNLINTKS